MEHDKETEIAQFLYSGKANILSCWEDMKVEDLR